MTIRHWDHIRTVLAISKTGSYRGAAQLLGLTKTTVSRHIEVLEHEIGEPVFVLKNRRWEPTKLGLRIIKISGKLEVDLEIAIKNFEPNEGQFDPLVVSTISYINAFFLARDVGKWTRKYPGSRLTIDASDEVVAVEDGKIDAAIRLGRPNQLGLSRVKLGESPVGIFTSKNFKGKDWVGLPSGLDELDEMVMARRYFGRGPTLRMDTFEAVAQAAASSEIACILPSCIASHFGDLSIVDDTNTRVKISRDVWFVFHEKRRTDPAVIALKHWVQNVFHGPNKCMCGVCLKA